MTPEFWGGFTNGAIALAVVYALMELWSINNNLQEIASELRKANSRLGSPS